MRNEAMVSSGFKVTGGLAYVSNGSVLFATNGDTVIYCTDDMQVYSTNGVNWSTMVVTSNGNLHGSNYNKELGAFIVNSRDYKKYHTYYISNSGVDDWKIARSVSGVYSFDGGCVLYTKNTQWVYAVGYNTDNFRNARTTMYAYGKTIKSEFHGYVYSFGINVNGDVLYLYQNTDSSGNVLNEGVVVYNNVTGASTTITSNHYEVCHSYYSGAILLWDTKNKIIYSIDENYNINLLLSGAQTITRCDENGSYIGYNGVYYYTLINKKTLLKSFDGYNWTIDNNIFDVTPISNVIIIDDVIYASFQKSIFVQVLRYYNNNSWIDIGEIPNAGSAYVGYVKDRLVYYYGSSFTLYYSSNKRISVDLTKLTNYPSLNPGSYNISAVSKANNYTDSHNSETVEFNKLVVFTIETGVGGETVRYEDCTGMKDTLLTDWIASSYNTHNIAYPVANEDCPEGYVPIAFADDETIPSTNGGFLSLIRQHMPLL